MQPSQDETILAMDIEIAHNPLIDLFKVKSFWTLEPLS